MRGIYYILKEVIDSPSLGGKFNYPIVEEWPLEDLYLARLQHRYRHTNIGSTTSRNFPKDQRQMGRWIYSGIEEISTIWLKFRDQWLRYNPHDPVKYALKWEMKSWCFLDMNMNAKKLLSHAKMEICHYIFGAWHLEMDLFTAVGLGWFHADGHF